MGRRSEWDRGVREKEGRVQELMDGGGRAWRGISMEGSRWRGGGEVEMGSLGSWRWGDVGVARVSLNAIMYNHAC